MPTALFSVSDKGGLIELARGLHQLGWDLLASGGTASALRVAGLPVEDIFEYTGSPEVLEGRVKTLHPAVHAGILARDSDRDKQDLERLNARLIDLVVVNLYPFRKSVAKADATLEDAIENIDIGGVALIRAAAKNFARVCVLTDPQDYDEVLAEISQMGAASENTRYRLARKAFSHTAAYDAAIYSYFERTDAIGSAHLSLELFLQSELRYGENPHQKARLYGFHPQGGPLGGALLQGKALSYNNLLDLDAAWRAAVAFERSTIVIVKHLSPCGIASSDNQAAAFPAALASDPVSAFGGVIAANRVFEADTARMLGDLFVECIAAPGYSPEAQSILAERKNLRLVSIPDLKLYPLYELRTINQGVLQQDIDLGDPAEPEWRVVSDRQPTQAEQRDLRFAWKACQHIKSNAIVFAQSEATVGIGGGQPNRVDCVRIAAQRAGERSVGAVMASDAFFPFPDSVDEAAQAGITAIISPGGSIRDHEAIEAANRANIAMVFSGVRHFRH